MLFYSAEYICAFARTYKIFTWHHGRVVKAVDSKSTGLRPQEFESPWCRFGENLLYMRQLSLVAEHLLRKQEVGSSILPVGWFFTVFNLHTHSAYDTSVVNAPVAQWIGHPPPKREIPGSSPGGSDFLNSNYWIQNQGKWIANSSQGSSFSLVVERWSYVPEVAGSTPARSILQSHFDSVDITLLLCIIWRHHGRVVKAVDSKSTGLCPQEFESPWCRILSQYLQSENISLNKYLFNMPT